MADVKTDITSTVTNDKSDGSVDIKTEIKVGDNNSGTISVNYFADKKLDSLRCEHGRIRTKCVTCIAG